MQKTRQEHSTYYRHEGNRYRRDIGDGYVNWYIGQEGWGENGQRETSWYDLHLKPDVISNLDKLANELERDDLQVEVQVDSDYATGHSIVYVEIEGYGEIEISIADFNAEERYVKPAGRITITKEVI